MERIMLRAKLHGAALTGADLHYEGSLAVDEELLEAAGILPGEQVHVYNITNGNRLVTYAISGPRGSRTLLLNGAAAHLGAAGDRVIVVTYGAMSDEEARTFTPRVLRMDEKNRILS